MKWVITKNEDNLYHYYATESREHFEKLYPHREILFETSHVDELTKEFTYYNNKNEGKISKKTTSSRPHFYSNDCCSTGEEYNEEYEQFMRGIRHIKSMDEFEIKESSRAISYKAWVSDQVKNIEF